jgi:hypothetical protein
MKYEGQAVLGCNDVTFEDVTTLRGIITSLSSGSRSSRRQTGRRKNIKSKTQFDP